MKIFARVALFLLFTLFATSAVALPKSAYAEPLTPEQRAAKRFEAIRDSPQALLSFLREMPKGGDLHNHLAGAIYAESLIDWATAAKLCVNLVSAQLTQPPCDPTQGNVTVSNRGMSMDEYDSMVDAWSMRNWNEARGSGHDHFFDTFDKFFPATENRTGEMLAEAANRAADDHLQYVELMHTADGSRAIQLGLKVGWVDDFAQFRKQLLQGGLQEVIAETRTQLDKDEARRKEVQHCRDSLARKGCSIPLRYLYQVLRGLPQQVVFTQILLGYELATVDPRFVGLNLVMAEDGYTAMHDFDLHMRILAFMRQQYPEVHLSLHAGELAPGLVPPEGLRNHIRDSVDRGGAERIGHGVDVMSEDHASELLLQLARQKVLVEICLTSNARILRVSGKQHPFAEYRKAGVPMALATDDEGVNRSDMTQEWLKAVETQNAGYMDLKEFARQSLEHSFLPGKSLWEKAVHFRRSRECAGDKPEAPSLTGECQLFLSASEKARIQWELERELAAFEKQF